MQTKKWKNWIYVWLGCLVLAAAPLRAEEIRFSVRHDHTLRSCAGELIFDDAGVEYKTAHKQHARTWKYEDIQQLGILGPKKLSIVTYEDSRWKLGKDRDFRFEITEGEISPSLREMLQKRLGRPVVSAIIPPGIEARYSLPVKHERGFGGTQGSLEISDSYIAYRTAAKEDSRVWRYEDISSIGTTGPYQLRLTSLDRVQGEYGGERNFVFTLKRRLDPEIYDFVWWKINGPQISSSSRK